MQVNIPYMDGMAGFFLRFRLNKALLCWLFSPKKSLDDFRFACKRCMGKTIQKYSYQMMVNFMVMNPMVFESVKNHQLNKSKISIQS